MKLIDFDKYGRRKIILDENKRKSFLFNIIMLILFILFFILVINNIRNLIGYDYNLYILGFLLVILCIIIGIISYKDSKKVKKIIPDYNPKLFLFVDWMDYKIVHEYNDKIKQKDLVNLSLEDLQYNMLVINSTKPSKPILNLNALTLTISVISIIIANYSPLFQFIKLDGAKDDEVLLIFDTAWKILTVFMIIFLFIMMSSFYVSYQYYDSARTKYEQYLQKKQLIEFLIYYKNNSENTDRNELEE